VVTERAERYKAEQALAAEIATAVTMFNRAGMDYLGCRVSVLHNEMAGLQLGAQAIEKQMKGMLQVRNPRLSWKGAGGHNLKKLLEEVGKYYLLPKQRELGEAIDHFETIYRERYEWPAGGSERFWDNLLPLDFAMFALCMAEDRDVLWGKRGTLTTLSFRVWWLRDPTLQRKAPIDFRDKWLVAENRALADVWPVLLPELQAVWGTGKS